VAALSLRRLRLFGLALLRGRVELDQLAGVGIDEQTVAQREDRALGTLLERLDVVGSNPRPAPPNKSRRYTIKTICTLPRLRDWEAYGKRRGRIMTLDTPLAELVGDAEDGGLELAPIRCLGPAR
jgi:hypothetical protein